MYSITMLDYILTWIKRLGQYQPDFVESITEDFIRKQMLTKYENKCFNSRIANDRFFVCNATPEEIFSFLSDTTKTLRQSEVELTIAQAKTERNNSKIYQLLDESIETIKKIEWNDRKEAQQLIGVLDKLLEDIDTKSHELEGDCDMEFSSNLIMADIKDVIPNPLNPRTNNAIKTDEMQRVIKEKGWEVPITCYQRGEQYIILSGHRRWEAAKNYHIRRYPYIWWKHLKPKKKSKKDLVLCKEGNQIGVSMNGLNIRMICGYIGTSVRSVSLHVK